MITIKLTNGYEDYDLKFELLDTAIAHKWLEELKIFVKNNCPIDDPTRFYNFPNSIYTKQYIVDYINNLITTINNYSPNLIDCYATLELTQDNLNYLHHIFEVYHGLYGEQDNNDFFKTAPIEVQQALADLNVWVHRYECFNSIPRFVCTWYGGPERKPLADSDYQHFSLHEEWGEIKINYCEVGKTLYDLYHDNDTYINPTAFKPLNFYSVDFTVRFTSKDQKFYSDLTNKVWDYFESNKKFFDKLGYSKYDPKLSLGWITVARIVTDKSRDEIINDISKYQRIKTIKISS